MSPSCNDAATAHWRARARPAYVAGEDSVADERILVVDDERDITALVAYHLARAGYRVSTASDGAAALKAIRAEPPDLIVLDLMLPGTSGYDVLAELRRRDDTKNLGVILLTARKEEPDRIKGLSAGADDYLTKPFSPEELVLRVGAVLRRLHAQPVAAGPVLRAGPVAIDRGALTVQVNGKPLDLTPIEYRLLLLLAERRGRVQSRPQLLEQVWEAQSDIQTRTVDMHVQRLRAKLGDAGELIETVRGFGYRMRGAERERAR
jgi:two-component system phosphate regulon response regulator PhoB